MKSETFGTNITEQWVRAWDLYYRGFVNGLIRVLLKDRKFIFFASI